MTQSLDLKPGEKVLEIGTGSGYQAAVLAELTDQVYTIEIVESLARKAKSILDARGYRGIQTRVGDGYRGWPAAAPFDAIIVTCSPDSPPQPLIDQLAVGGRMCIPVGSGLYGQELVLITRQADGSLKRATIAPVAFVPMTGEAQERD
jgi:protein-L-isoaspartate(D-aspartate) O-methyltransferase